MGADDLVDIQVDVLLSYEMTFSKILALMKGACAVTGFVVRKSCYYVTQLEKEVLVMVAHAIFQGTVVPEHWLSLENWRMSSEWV
jgi:hypothetical protein